MLFLTPWFVLFACACFPAYWLLRHPPARLAVLLLFCVVFHTHFAGPAGVLPIFALGLATYLAGLSRNPAACIAASVLCVAALVFYKYTQFLCASLVGVVWPEVADYLSNQTAPLLAVGPPLAISFFVFEFVHYLLEVRRGGEPIRSVPQFCLFALFWPSIVAGPVKRYTQFLPAVAAGARQVSKRAIAAGLVLVAGGLVKKLAADNLTAFITYHQDRFDGLPGHYRWLVLGAIGLRILWDFSGYSDMAIGFAWMFGVRLPQNFRWPYLATSPADFWQRWHISLSLWIRDYVYIPIGGGRCGALRKAANGLLAFAVCGLWHGAAWNFLVWGLYHGLGLAVTSHCRALGRAGAAVADWFAAHRVAAWACTMLFVHVGWLVFFFPLQRALEMAQLLFWGRG